MGTRMAADDDTSPDEARALELAVHLNNLLRAYSPGEGLLPTGQELEQIAHEEAERRTEAERVAHEEAERRAEAERVMQEQAARLAALEDELARLRGQAQADE